MQRSISLYGLSDVILTFDEDTDDYFARQMVFQRLSEVTYPTGVTPVARAAFQPVGAGVPLRAGKPRPHAAGIENI